MFGSQHILSGVSPRLQVQRIERATAAHCRLAAGAGVSDVMQAIGQLYRCAAVWGMIMRRDLSWVDAVTLVDIAAAVPLAIWLYLLLLRGRFWAPRELPHCEREMRARVVAVVPARDEATTIARAVRSLLEQQLAVPLHVIVVDDGSTDGTEDAARAAAAAVGAGERLTVLHGAPLQQGWTGKLWAMAQGVAAATRLDPDYLLLTDADIEHDRRAVAELAAHAEAHRLDLTSLMVRLSTSTFAERCLIPVFVFFFFMLYPPRWIASARRTTAGAAGGCMLIRPTALERAGGLGAIRGRIIDDCALAAAVKDSGGSLWLGLTRVTRSLRVYGSFGEIGAMISRTAFNQLRHSWWRLALALLGLLVTYVAPAVLACTREPVLAVWGAAAWVAMTLCYVPIVRFHRVPAPYALLLPAVALFYAGATLHSAVRYALGRGGRWKGRTQDARASGGA